MEQSNGRSISLEEVRLILSGWADSGALIRCDARIGPVVCFMRAKLRPLLDGPANIQFASDDLTNQFSFAIRPDFIFVYAEPRGLPEAEDLAIGSLFFIFPSRYYEGESDSIVLHELKTE